MQSFEYYSPTEIIFGKGAEEKTAEKVKKHGGSRVFIVYGGGSVVKSGLLARLQNQLEAAGIPYDSIGGVQPNPLMSLARKGIQQALEFKADFILAVGGGSVIDTSKAIAHGIADPEVDIWEYWSGKRPITKTTPVGVVLTISAAGSETSNSAVLTNDEIGKKCGTNTDLNRPRFAIMNPELTFTLPAWQTACGITDMMMHTMERYFSKDDDMETTDAIAEAVLRTCMTEGVKVLVNPTDYTSRANIMWAGTVAHNDITGCGTTGDWATHCIEHELSGMFDVSHGAGLAAVWGSWARYTRQENLPRFVRFAHNVMGVETADMDCIEASEAGIKALEAFFQKIGMPTNIHSLIGRDVTDGEIETMADKCTNGDTTTVGGLMQLRKADVMEIYRMAR